METKRTKKDEEEIKKIEPPEVEVVEGIKEEEPAERIEKGTFNKETWHPKTGLGKKIKSGEITSLDQVLDNGYKILEAEIVDALVPNINIDLLLIGQSKGKFGGGQRRVFKQTQKKTKEGNKPSFSTIALVGNNNGYVGLGHGKSRETVPAREKAIRKSKLNIIKIARGCGSWQCNCKEPHSVPFTVKGKCGSVVVKLIPAPKGTGLIIEPELGKILKFAGIKDVWSKTSGHTKTKSNSIKATFDALKNIIKMKHGAKDAEKLGIVEGLAIEEKAAEKDKAE